MTKAFCNLLEALFRATPKVATKRDESQLLNF